MLARVWTGFILQHLFFEVQRRVRYVAQSKAGRQQESSSGKEIAARNALETAEMEACHSHAELQRDICRRRRCVHRVEPFLASMHVLVGEFRLLVDATQKVLLEHPNPVPARVGGVKPEAGVGKYIVVESSRDGQRMLLLVDLEIVLADIDVDIVARVCGETSEESDSWAKRGQAATTTSSVSCRNSTTNE